MLFRSVSLLALLLVGETCASAASDFARNPVPLHRRHASLAENLRRDALEWINTPNERRQASAHTSSSAAPPSATAGIPTSFNDPNLNSTITSACMNPLSSISNITNPAGMAACYNVLYLNNQTGVFEAELRLYQIIPPFGSFAGVDPLSIRVGLGYPHAGIQQEMRRRKRDGVDELLQGSFIGQIDPKLSLAKLQTSDIMSLVIPTISLYANDPTTNQVVSANVTSASTVYFVVGLFKAQSANAPAAAVPSAAAVAAQKAAAFTLPGVTFGIFPVGLIVTGIWTVLFVGIFAMGTVGRIQARKQYRMNMKLAQYALRDRSTWHHKTFGDVTRPNYYAEHVPRSRPMVMAKI